MYEIYFDYGGKNNKKKDGFIIKKHTKILY